MPLSLRRLDTQAPSEWLDHWGGVDEFVTSPFVDEATQLRATAGHDPINYVTDQRPQGDLFKRDQVTEINVTNIVNFLGSRTGVCYNVGMVRLIPDSEFLVAEFTVPNTTPHWIPIGWGVSNGSDTANAFLLTLKIKAGATLATKATLGDTFFANLPVDRGIGGVLLTAGTTYQLLLKNTSGTRRNAAAYLLVQPSTQ